MALGGNSTVNPDSENSIAIGAVPVADGPNSIAIGSVAETTATFNNQIAIGTNAQTENGDNNIAIGSNASARGNLQGSSLALMPNAVATRQYAIAIGTNTDATQENSIALGTNGQATNYANQINIRNTARGSLPLHPDRATAAAGGVTNGDLYVLTPGGPDNPGSSYVLAIF